jgi:hypothetical protein
MLQESATSIEVTRIALDIHTAQRHVEMGLRLWGEHAHEPTVIAARCMLITHNESEGITLGKSTDSRRGMELLQQITNMIARG